MLQLMVRKSSLSAIRRAKAGVIAIGLALGLGAALSGCQYNPATGGRVFNLFSMEQEIMLGEGAKNELTNEYGGKVRDSVPTAYLDEIGYRLSAEVEPEFLDLPWEYTLLDSNVINAFALPGGKVFMSRALAERLPDEASLAAVIGHEIGHVTARHGGRRITQTYSVQMGIGVLSQLLTGADSAWLSQVIPFAVTKGGEGYLLSYNRDQELEADALGMRYMTRAGYDPSAIIDVMRVLEAAGGGGSTPEFLSTHPHPDSRIKQAQKFLAGQYSETQGNPNYQRYEQRYRARMLGPLAELRRQRGEPEVMLADFDLAQPATWCAHCAAAHTHARAGD